MTNKLINTILKEIEKDINEMDKIDGIKKLINKYNTVHVKIDECKNLLKKLDSTINNKYYEDESDNSENSEDSSNDLNENINILELLNKKVNENLETIDLEELCDIYVKSNAIISKCKKYIETQKMEIINVE